MSMLFGTRLRRWALAVALLAGSTSLLGGQALEVQQSSGFVEVLLPDLGWRQAVLGRQLPSGAVVTSWREASARITFGGSTVTLGSLSHIQFLSVGKDLIRLSLQAGAMTVESSAPAYEIEFRELTVRIEQGTASLSDGVLSVSSGTVLLMGAREEPLPISPGRSISLLSPSIGPIFGKVDR